MHGRVNWCWMLLLSLKLFISLSTRGLDSFYGFLRCFLIIMFCYHFKLSFNELASITSFMIAAIMILKIQHNIVWDWSPVIITSSWFLCNREILRSTFQCLVIYFFKRSIRYWAKGVCLSWTYGDILHNWCWYFNTGFRDLIWNGKSEDSTIWMMVVIMTAWIVIRITISWYILTEMGIAIARAITWVMWLWLCTSCVTAATAWLWASLIPRWDTLQVEKWLMMVVIMTGWIVIRITISWYVLTEMGIATIREVRWAVQSRLCRSCVTAAAIWLGTTLISRWDKLGVLIFMDRRIVNY